MFKCYTLKMANYLIDRGCKIAVIQPDGKDNKFLDFLFRRDDHLQDCINDYYAENSKTNKVIENYIV